MLGSIFPNINQGSLTQYIDLPTTQIMFFSLSLYASTFITFINNVAIPFAYASRNVVYKHTDAGLYTEAQYVVANAFTNAPLHIVTDLLFCTPLYFIAAYAKVAQRWCVDFFSYCPPVSLTL